MGSSREQGALWSTDPAGWAAHAERRTRPLFDAVLDRVGAGPGTRLLDAGCGAGLCAGLAAARGAQAVGLDAAEGLVALARERHAPAAFVVGDLEALPFPDGAFDAVVACNSVLYAADPHRAVRELGRVAARAGRVVVTVGTGPEQATCAALVHALLRPGVEASTRARLELADPREVDPVMDDAGLRVLERFEVAFPTRFADVEDAVRAQTPAGSVQAAARHSGRAAVEAALRGFFEERLQADGSVVMRVSFTCTLAERRA
jgi:SAM-dependent methyltransferase